MFARKQMVVKTYKTGGGCLGCLGIFLPRFQAADKYEHDVGKMARKGYVVLSQSETTNRITVTYKLAEPAE